MSWVFFSVVTPIRGGNDETTNIATCVGCVHWWFSNQNAGADPNHCYNAAVSPSTYWREELFRIDHSESLGQI